MRLDDFRSTLKEIVDVNQHGATPRDKKDLDTSSYGKCSKVQIGELGERSALKEVTANSGEVTLHTP